MAKKIGRPSEYKESYCQAIIDFFANHELLRERVCATGDDGYEKTEEVPNEYPTLTDFARKYKITRSSINLWANKHPEFSEALKEAKELQHEIIIKGALMGYYNASFSIFAMKNVGGWRDRSEVEHSGEIIFSSTDLEKARNRFADSGTN